MPSLLSFNNRQKALQEYSSISEQLPSTNFAMKRDVQEGQARCLAHLGRHEEALEMAADLVSCLFSYTVLNQGQENKLAARSRVGGPGFPKETTSSVFTELKVESARCGYFPLPR
jgi:hypothetical protein